MYFCRLLTTHNALRTTNFLKVLLMEPETTALFFDGYSARPAPVSVLLNGGSVHLHDPYDNRLIQSYLLKGASHNSIGATHFLYLDAHGLVYLQLTSAHPLAAALEPALAEANKSWPQKLMRQNVWILLPLLALLAAGLYFFLLGLVPFLGLRMMGKESEINLGNRLHQVMLSEVDLFGGTLDTSGTAQLQAFARQLKLSNTYPIRLTLVHSDVVNAYALPGGQVVVYTGLLKKLKSPEALAALLAHESTHVNQRHSLRSLLRSSANGLMVSILFGDATGVSGALVGNIENLSGLRYSRGLESEADEKGMDLLRANGIPPDGMVQLMQTLEKEGDIPDALSFASSHPLTSSRISSAKAYCRRYGNLGMVNRELKAAFEQLQKL